MSRYVIIPDCISRAIHVEIDRALNGRPCDDESRQYIFDGLLKHFDEHGVVPSITLTENARDE